ncbi:MAG: TonB-dependent receptor [Novosphingobium sp.]|nr:TonB-dependent receptor [Novosphingobium sp.]MBO9603458.1 TonB-dependent receptor [Novosphingobium sp.]
MLLRRLPAVLAIATCAAPALADEPAKDEIVVTAPGAGVDYDDSLALGRGDVWRTGAPDLLGALTRDSAGITLQDAQNNPWQPNLVYRGFVASPLQGQAQGLAAYLDGGRFNQPFGDTVNFDLIPEAALRSVHLVDASPAYGLNALGGAIVLETATGASDPGFDGSLSLGSYGEREASFSGGAAGSGGLSFFGALEYRAEDGWRDHSPSYLANSYVDLGLDREWGGIHAKLFAAHTDLTGNGVSPVELLAARRQSVLSWPDNTRNDYGRISLHPWLALGPDTQIEATLYRQRLESRSVNGDIADIDACEDAPGYLCLDTVDDDGREDDAEDNFVTDANGNRVRDTLDGAPYGVLNRGTVHTRSSGVLAQLIDRRALPGGTNRLALGLSYDASRTDFASSTELGAFTQDRGVDGLGVFIDQTDGSIAPVGLAATTRYWGLFLADTLPLGHGLSAELGLRYNRERIALADRIGSALDGDHSFDRLNPGIELDWQLAPALALRAGYAETNRAPTPAELSCADAEAPCSLANFFVSDPPLRQVVAHGWELGASGGGRAGGWSLTYLVSAWRARNSDDIQYVASEIRGRAWFRNVGETRRQGIEAKLEARRGGLRLAASYAFTDATYRSGLTLSSPSNPAASEDGTIAVVPGDRLPGIPRHSATFSADYEGRLAGGPRFSLGGDLIARSSQVLVGDEANLTPPVPGYAIVNLRASIALARGIALTGELRNVFDRKYATFGTFSEVDEVELTEAPGASDPRAYGPGSPRRWTVGLRGSF